MIMNCNVELIQGDLNVKIDDLLGNKLEGLIRMITLL
jgi:hypothetical protein